MNTLKGAGAVLLIGFAFYFAPGNAEFNALSNGTSFFVVVGVLGFIYGGVGLFIWGLVAETKLKRSAVAPHPSTPSLQQE